MFDFKTGLKKMINDKVARDLAKDLIIKIENLEKVTNHLTPLKDNIRISLNEKYSVNWTEQNSYLASEDYLNEYLTLCHEMYHEQGYEIPEFGCCPILMADNYVIRAKHALCKRLEPYTGILYDQLSCNLKHYQEYLQIVLKVFTHIIKVKG